MRLRNALIIAGALALGGIGLSYAQVLPQPGPPVPIAGAYNTTPPTLTDGQAGWVQLDSSGKLLVNSTFTPSGTQDVNVAKINGITPLMGNGVTGTGSPRVTIASDNTAFSVNATLSAETTKVIGTINQGTSPWVNNVSQINGVTPLMGNGPTGTGSQRVTLASDSTGIVALPAAGTSVVGTKAAGTAAATSALTGSVYNSTTPTLTDGQQAARQADTTGAVRVSTEGGKNTYSATAAIALAATASDVFIINGSASKTVHVTRIQVSGDGTTATTIPIFFVKRSAANTGGTSSAPTAVPHDSTNAAATATLLAYTANPTSGASVGSIRAVTYTFPTITSPGVAANPVILDFTTRNSQGVVLRGTAQALAISLNSTTVVGGALTVDIEWTEE